MILLHFFINRGVFFSTPPCRSAFPGGAHPAALWGQGHERDNLDVVRAAAGSPPPTVFPHTAGGEHEGEAISTIKDKHLRSINER